MLLGTGINCVSENKIHISFEGDKPVYLATLTDFCPLLERNCSLLFVCYLIKISRYYLSGGLPKLPTTICYFCNVLLLIFIFISFFVYYLSRGGESEQMLSKWLMSILTKEHAWSWSLDDKLFRLGDLWPWALAVLSLAEETGWSRRPRCIP